MKTLDQTIFGRVLGWLARQVCRHPAWFLWPQLLLFIGSVVYTAKYLQFDPSRDNLVGSGKKYHQNFLKFKAEFPEQDDLVVIVESDDLAPSWRSTNTARPTWSKASSRWSKPISSWTSSTKATSR